MRRSYEESEAIYSIQASVQSLLRLVLFIAMSDKPASDDRKRNIKDEVNNILRSVDKL